MTTPNASPHHILLVDDDPDIRDALSALLEEEGYRVVTATNGEEALERMSDSQPPCIVILDLMMPVMNGWEFLRRVRSGGGRMASTPVCVVSAYADRAPAEADAVLQKPLEVDALLAIVTDRC